MPGGSALSNVPGNIIGFEAASDDVFIVFISNVEGRWKYLQSLLSVQYLPRKIADTRTPFLDDAKDLPENSDEIDTEHVEFHKSNSESCFLIIMEYVYSSRRALKSISWHRSTRAG